MGFSQRSTTEGQLHKIILPLISVLIIITGLSCGSNNVKEVPVTKVKPIEKRTNNVSPSSLLFGIDVDSFNVIHGRIRANSFLSDLLSGYGITPSETDLIIRNSNDIFNVREIRSGNNFTVLTNKDSAEKLRYFIYENDPTLYYIFSFNDSLHITPFRVNPRTEIKFSALTIETSLWDALIGKGLNPELAVDLSDIYAWTVDFFGLQKGDRFKFIYEENFIGDKPIGTGRIIGAKFFTAEKEIYAIPVIQQGKESYYDKQGNSLRKEFLKAPLHFSRIASGFSSARMHPILRIVRPHYGVDYAAPAGTPVYSIGDGTVISATTEPEAGRIIRIRHNSVYTTAYMHLSGFARGISGGVKVTQGEVIGYVGMTGLATGPHLDFRFYKNGYPVDPLKVEAPPVEPVLDENRAKFEKIKSVIADLLDSFN
jgi:murein DD-endopeptidase MepM/ murein hydrolase activator NlpD